MIRMDSFVAIVGNNMTFKRESNENGDDVKVALLQEPHPEDVSSSGMWWEHVQRTARTMLGYDISFALPLQQAMMTRVGAEPAAPITGNFLNIATLLELNAVLPSAFIIPGLYGELRVKEQSWAELSNKESDAEQRLELEKEIKALRQKIARMCRNAAIGATPAMMVTVVAFGASGSFLSALGQRPEVAIPAQRFLQPYMLGAVATWFRLSLEMLLLSIDKARPAAIIAMSSFLGGVGLAYLLGFEAKLGMAGLGWAMAIQMTATACGFSAYLKWGMPEFHVFKKLLSSTTADWAQIKEFFKNSGILIVGNLADVCAFATLNLFANGAPRQNMAMFVLNANMLLVAASSQTNQMMVGQRDGEEAAKGARANFRRVGMQALAGVAGQLTLQLPLLAATVVAPHQIAWLIGSTGEGDPSLATYLAFTAGVALVDGLRYHLLQICRALGDNFISTLIATLPLWLGVLTSYFMQSHFDAGLLEGFLAGATLALGGLAIRAAQLLQPRTLEQKAAAKNSRTVQDVLTGQSQALGAREVTRVV